ncbi:YkgJ family cysteine cluster protein [Flavihumibacter rivuli]|uniref:YkgJ family cysteine cluster protein n=1 Tax=Flavihumibacter rivuli TaxID=2838156 RepID=UPI001BDE11EC|nr:YkgJ family cysteine cluster protein [Flavihumibacter rivuli]ULQ57484.1 YkgJ family cysteine cluster protein [Flavihumibacter rivuli]
MSTLPIQTDLAFIELQSHLKVAENDKFKDFLKGQPHYLVDELAVELNAAIEPLIDCTTCGNCCRSLMITVSSTEADRLALVLNKSLTQTKAEYLEESMGGQLVINTIPCHFLECNKCTIYEDRFADCRAFPNLHLPELSKRIFATLMHYGRCPIVYNVIEAMKERTNFMAV